MLLGSFVGSVASRGNITSRGKETGQGIGRAMPIVNAARAKARKVVMVGMVDICLEIG